jgi:hypothetical protein
MLPQIINVENTRKKYHHEYYLKKKNGLPTRQMPLLSEEERKIRRHKIVIKCGRNFRKRKKELKLQYLGKNCFVCGRDGKLISHRKDGFKHKDFNFMTIQEYKDELSSGQYVNLCYRCHKGVHFCMDILHLTWTQLLISFNK